MCMSLRTLLMCILCLRYSVPSTAVHVTGFDCILMSMYVCSMLSAWCLQVDACLAVLRQLLSYQTTHPLLLYLQFRCLQTGLFVIDKDPSIFQAFVQKVQSNMIS